MKYYFYTEFGHRFEVQDLEEMFNIVKLLQIKFKWVTDYHKIDIQTFEHNIKTNVIGLLTTDTLWWLPAKEYKYAKKQTKAYKINKKLNNYMDKLLK